ncbi:hypothetical protein VB716_16875 [Synechococcus sp. CCY9201]|uniref:hypothetical protein n=1 Tax=unclassified Synechococcus TaxID=2626047 RepID=UPI0018CE7468|nr:MULTISPECIES: hypothetical protein [unclassified Synechococcus]MEA5475894.1 hypothetical protein [Synechococcus sp. CCY9201]QPN66734.1 hypothetical protein H8F26_18910 [Synechococcus sp. CBW1006]
MFESSPPAPAQLDVFEAVRQGWAAFSRAPWVFVGFSLLLTVVNAIFSGIQRLGTNEEGLPISGPMALVALLGAVAGVIVSLWGSVALVRGSWSALEGGQPSFATFVRWDGAAMIRLFRNGLVLGVLVGLMLLVAAGLAFGVAQLSQLLAVLPLLVALLVLIYVVINQKFLAQVSLLEGLGPISAIQRGRAVVDPQWGQVLLLGLAEFAVMLLGLMACVVGLFVAIPVVACISTAAYRQVFGTTDLTGLMTGSDAGQDAASLV